MHAATPEEGFPGTDLHRLSSFYDLRSPYIRHDIALVDDNVESAVKALGLASVCGHLSKESHFRTLALCRISTL